MMNTVVKRTIKLAMLSLLVLFSANSQASSVFGKVGYSHYPFHITIGYKGHGHGGHHYYKPKYYGHGGRHYYKPRHYGYGGHHYYKPRYYGYKNHYRHGNRYYRHPAYRSHSYSRGHRPQHHDQRYYYKKNKRDGRYIHH